MKKLSFCLIIALLCFQSLKSQVFEKGIVFPESNSNKDYRPRNFIAKGPDNLIYLGFGGINVGNTRLQSKFGFGIFNDDSISLFTKENSQIPSVDVTGIAFQGNKVWVSSFEGLMCYQAGAFTHFTKSNAGLAEDRLKAVSCSPLRVWVISDTTLSIISDQGTIKVNLGNYELINDIEAGVNEEAWVASNKGLLKINSNGQIIQVFDTTNSGLYPNQVEEILKAGDGTLWIFGPQTTEGNKVKGGIQYLENETVKNWRTMHPNLSGCQQTIPTKFKGVASDAGGRLYLMLPPVNPNVDGLTLMRFSKSEADYFHFSIGDPNLITSEGYLLPYESDKVIVFSGSRNGSDLKSLWIYKLEKNSNLSSDGIKYLDINQVRAPFSNELQIMHWDLEKNKHYEVPAGSCKNTLFGSSVWLGGLVNKQLHIAAETYRQFGRDFYPGPIQVSNPQPGDSLAHAELSKIWKLSGQDIENMKFHHKNGDIASGKWLPPASILSWPAKGKGSYANAYAPFVDSNNNGLYEPLMGEYPVMKGDQMVYWISNDANGIHSETESEPLQVELHNYAYAFNCPTISDDDPNSILNYTTFYEVEIVNKNSEKIDSMVTGIWQDLDIGFYGDDYIGCNPKGGYCFAYNSKEIDNPLTGYGINPPAQSTLLLSAPGDSNSGSSLKGFHYYENDFSVSGNPIRPEHYWNYLNGRWKDGTPVTYGGNGYGGQDTASFMYCGADDPAGRPNWSEPGEQRAGGDRRSLLTTRYFSLLPEEKKVLKFAMFTSRGNYSSILNQVKSDAIKLKEWFANNNYPSCMQWSTGIENANTASIEMHVYPNPGRVFQLDWTMSGKTKIQVFDFSGKLLMEKYAENETQLDLSGYSPGMYLIRLNQGIRQSSKKVIVN